MMDAVELLIGARIFAVRERFLHHRTLCRTVTRRALAFRLALTEMSQLL